MNHLLTSQRFKLLIASAVILFHCRIWKANPGNTLQVGEASGTEASSEVMSRLCMSSIELPKKINTNTGIK